MRALQAWQVILIGTIAAPLCLEGELLPIRSYTTADGLAADQVECIVPDSRGFIWFCTPEGLSRFDGYRIVSFGAADGLPYGAVDSFLETRSGTYFAGTDGGLSQLDSRTKGKTFIAYRQANDGFDRPVYLLRESSSGRIWCGTRGGLFEVLSGRRFRRQPLPGGERILVTDVLEDTGGKLWVATEGGIFVVRKDGTVQRITTEDGLPNNWVNALLLDRAGRLWAGTRDGLVLVRDGGAAGRNGVQRVYKEKDGLPASDLMALAEGPDGDVWIGTSFGIGRLHTVNDEPVFRNLTRRHGLTDRQIIALATDKAGNMWAGTESAGVMRIGSVGFITFREQDGLKTDRVFSVFADRTGTVMAVTKNGAQPGRAIEVFNGVGFQTVIPKVYGTKSGWGQHQVLLQSRTGEWWAATKVGLCQFARMRAAGLARTPPKACYARDAEVFRIFEDSKGGIWASAQSTQGDRLLRWDPARKAISRLDGGPDRHRLVSAFAEDHDGNIWMGLWGGGELFRYDGRQFTGFKPTDGAPSARINALLVDHGGRLWMGSGGGLGLLENPGSATFRVRTFDTASGLASDAILCIVEDNNGRIYAGTVKGVDRLDPLTGRIKHFGAADGLPHGEMKSAFRDVSGKLWFATTQGLSRLTPTVDRPPEIPSVLITDLETGGERYPVSQAGEALIRPPKLDPSRNQLQVKFAGFNDEPGESLSYKYKLEGTDKTWHDTREHTVNYAALEPGSYRFLVKAFNSEDKPSAAAAEIDFGVLPPFWRRWWFELLALAALASLVLAAHRYRVAQAVKLERMRTSIATDLHDDIGASLSQIAVLSEVARVDRSSGPSQPNDRLDRVATLARECAESMSDVVWSIRAEPEGLDSLIRRMREFASDLLESQAISFELRAAEKNPNFELSLQARRQLLLIFKECIHNAARHSGGTAVLADFEMAGQEILLCVRDNGRGIDETGGAPGRSGGNGIPSMKRRAESLGGRMEWTASPSGGCTVEVHLPIRHSTFGKPGL